MISNSDNVKQVFSHAKDMINNTILNILLLFHNVLKTLKQKYMLNLTSSDKTLETLSPL